MLSRNKEKKAEDNLKTYIVKHKFPFGFLFFLYVCLFCLLISIKHNIIIVDASKLDNFQVHLIKEQVKQDVDKH